LDLRRSGEDFGGVVAAEADEGERGEIGEERSEAVDGHIVVSRATISASAGTPPDTFAIESATIGPHPFVLIGPPGHPLAKRRRLSLADLADETVLLREQGSGTRVLMERLVRSANVKWRTHREMGSNETIKQTVMAGLGIALISAHTIAAEVRAGSLIVFDVEGLPAMRTWSVIKRKDKRLLPAGQALWNFLGTSGAQFLPELPQSATAT
jgi:DNA-binding transcriptional LysR family regulator